MALSVEVQNQIRERFSPHTEAYTLIAKDVAGDKRGSTVYDTLTEDVWAKHFDGIARIALCPMATQGLVQWAILDVDCTKYADFSHLYMGRYPSSGGRLHIYFRFDKEIPVHDARAFLTIVATHFGFRKTDLFPSEQGTKTISVPQFNNDYEAKLFLEATNTGRSVAEYYELFNIKPSLPPCVNLVAKSDLIQQRDNAFSHGLAVVARELGNGAVEAIKEVLTAEGNTREIDKIGKPLGSSMAYGCAMLESLNKCGGNTCPHHRDYRRVTTDTTPSDGVTVYLSADNVVEAYAVSNLEDGSLSTFYVKFNFCPDQYVPFKAGHLGDRLAVKRNIVGIAMRNIKIEKEALEKLENRIMLLAKENSKTQYVGHANAVMAKLSTILEELPHTPPEKISADEGMWASNAPDGRTALPKTALVEELTKLVKEATRTTIHGTLQRLCEDGHLIETTLNGHIVYTVDAPSRLRFQTREG